VTSCAFGPKRPGQNEGTSISGGGDAFLASLKNEPLPWTAFLRAALRERTDTRVAMPASEGAEGLKCWTAGNYCWRGFF